MLRILAILLLSLALAGCSSTRLAYHQAGWWAPWAARDYIPLDRSQRGMMRAQVRDLRDWHCASEIPLYHQWIARRREDLRLPAPEAATIQQWLEEAQAAYQTLAERVTPPAAQLLATLDDSQVERFRASLAEKNRELEEKYLEPPLADQIREREERLHERLENLFGYVNERQSRLVTHWSEARGRQNQGWLDNRHRWQGELLAALEERDHDDVFQQQLARLITAPQTLHSPDYQEQSAQARAQGIALTAGLLQTADKAQMMHLDEQLADWQSRLEGLDCQA